eukprot:GHRR01017168.1.p1 GENE.GHRR01017168.1~~GHRR01017168.1.p1  ORF type:complete len:125 (-),score=37.99 GHRR01017168.1:660-1034(-)
MHFLCVHLQSACMPNTSQPSFAISSVLVMHNSCPHSCITEHASLMIMQLLMHQALSGTVLANATAAGASHAAVYVYHVGSAKVVKKLAGQHTVNVRDISYDHSTNRLATCGFDKTVKVLVEAVD